MTRVGVLALQGDVREHTRVLTALGADVTLVRRPDDLASVDGLVLPGGESSVIDKLSRAFGMQQPVRDAIAGGMPVYGTCAGMILLADRIANPIDGQESFGGLDVTVQRNAFGGQVESFETEITVAGFDGPVHAAFIRAPLVVEVRPAARALATLPGGGVVAVRQGNLVATAFHPEVSGETRFHELFLQLVRAAR
ncbi:MULTISPECIES: pyridoxal 5'-phosphate synthase glutaminase subunit PdxT [unclassified Microbacterium]|uniref:pyridoxal 5'-phosphate synthase glutaminase subunit PdxT n=1 Tax=unclassified Microbacterium TaxID=2609290 RepID=UPI000DB79B3A|nr:MAG: pyridoxal 5'-phosphate synthase glutaminase subunit PdxT [Microbacterium sp.]PZU32599.1 MAG: pyridoxal 5'-phosphate synthase glutaminase subunit PdxT [Microbacterium sp.]